MKLLLKKRSKPSAVRKVRKKVTPLAPPPLRVFAILVAGKWVEFRAGEKAPIKAVSEASFKQGRKTVTLTQTNWLNGDFLGSCTARHLNTLVNKGKISLRSFPSTMIPAKELSPSEAKLLLNQKWRISNNIF